MIVFAAKWRKRRRVFLPLINRCALHHGAPELRGAERGRYYGSDNASVGMDGNSKTAGIAKTFAAIPTALMRIDAACRQASLTIAEV